MLESASKFDLGSFQTKELKKNGDQYFLRKLRLAGTEAHFFFTQLEIQI
jgi:hypothetical protein